MQAKHLTFQAILGKTYTIQYKSSLEDATWQHQADFPTEVSSHQEEIIVPVGPATRGFFRLTTPLVP